jgi:hypothetical protein
MSVDALSSDELTDLRTHGQIALGDLSCTTQVSSGPQHVQRKREAY